MKDIINSTYIKPLSIVFFIYVALISAKLYNYLLFHTLVEIFGIVMAFTIFVIAWHSRRHVNFGFYVFLGIMYLWIGMIDLAHMLSFPGMNILVNIDANLPTQLHITGRYFEAFALFTALFYVSRKLDANKFLFYSGFAVSIALAIIFLGYFPDAFVEGVGLTPFKVISEYVIVSILLGAMYLLWRKRSSFKYSTVLILTASICSAVLAELSFTLYTDPHGAFNLIGHLFRVASHLFIYSAIISDSLHDPQSTLYRDLKQSENALRKSEKKYQQALEAMEESRAMYRILTETSPESIKLFNKDGRLIYINRAGLEEYHLKSIQEASSFDYLTLISEEHRELFKQAMADAFSGRLNRIEVGYKKASASEIHLETFVPIRGRNGAVVNVLAFSRDITDEKKANQAKTEFISMASHQLRTPLTNIGFSLEALDYDFAGSLNSEQRQYVKDAREDVEQMKELISRLLNISRIEAGTFTDHPRPIEVEKFVKEIRSGFELFAQKRDVILENNFKDDIPSRIEADPEILKNILQNLVSNAIKYTPSGGLVSLNVEAGNPHIIFSIKDSGKGIPKHMHSQIFTKMYKAYDLMDVREKKSSGLGLYIAKILTENLGGRIWFDTAEGKGSTFYISIPIKASKKTV